MSNLRSIILGTGSYLPSQRIPNDHFLDSVFYESSGERSQKDNKDVIKKFREITTIEERRYIKPEYVTSDIAYFAARSAIDDAGIDQESLDYIIVAHNFGDVKYGTNRSDLVPALAARVKSKLGIDNPFCVAYDLPFGCPGWLQGIVQADYFIKSGDAKRVLVIGAETISRVIDPHDRDSMIYADGAGATLLGVSTDGDSGILGHLTRSDTKKYAEMLTMDHSYNKEEKLSQELYLKMNGRRLYQYALETVPLSIKACLEKCDLPLSAINKILIHQANGKMDDAIVERLYKLYGDGQVPQDVMPMIIAKTGNSSVATIPTLLDMILHNKIKDQHIFSGDHVVFASVGAGMNINALVYRFA